MLSCPTQAHPERTYSRRRPEQGVLHQVLREHLNTALEQAALRSATGCGYPDYVRKEFQRLLDCGLLCRGFARMACKACHFEHLVAFCCKGRLCPSCTARRMAETALRLTDSVLPVAPYRQWTLSLPWDLRPWLARDNTLLGACLRVCIRELFNYQRAGARRAGVRDGQCGSVTFVHRFDSQLRLNVHFHVFTSDGVFARDEFGEMRFCQLPPPSDADVERLVGRIKRRIEQLVACQVDPDAGDDIDDEPMAAVIAEAHHRRTHRRFTWSDGPDNPPAKGRCSNLDGFSLHADVAVTACDRAGLARMLRYGARPPLAQNRLALRPDGQVVYRLRKPTTAGRSEVVFTPEAFIRRLAALIPPPWLNLTRFHGVFAPASAARPAVLALVPQPDAPVASNDVCNATTDIEVTEPPTDLTPQPSAHRIGWAELLKRTMDIDVQTCPRCGGRMRLVQLVKDKPVIDKILSHLNLPTDPPPVASARPPPQTELAWPC